MEMSKVKDGNYYVVQSFMVKDLKLKGLELACYAIIYGFSQAEGQVFNGSLQYLSDWTCSSKQAVMTALKKLVDKGMLIKTDKFVNNVKFVEYSATDYRGIQETCIGVVKKLDTDSNKIEGGNTRNFNDPIQETSPNNINNNLGYNLEDNIENNKSDKLDKSAVARKKYIHLLIRNFYIDENEPFLDQFDYLIDQWVEIYGDEKVGSCLRYFLACWTGYDQDGKPILNKYGYFKSSVEQGLNKKSYEPENLPKSMSWLLGN